MEKIILLPEVTDELNQLIKLLYEESYFAFIESAIEYADKILDFIHSIPDQRCKLTSDKKYGVYYCTFKANKKTTWYICFDRQNKKYIVRYLTNNHSKDYPSFIRH